MRKSYIKSGYILSWKDKKKHLYYKCCCLEKDLPELKAGERWHIYRVCNVIFYTNYPDSDLDYSIKSIRSAYV